MYMYVYSVDIVCMTGLPSCSRRPWGCRAIWQRHGYVRDSTCLPYLDRWWLRPYVGSNPTATVLRPRPLLDVVATALRGFDSNGHSFTSPPVAQHGGYGLTWVRLPQPHFLGSCWREAWSYRYHLPCNTLCGRPAPSH